MIIDAEVYEEISYGIDVYVIVGHVYSEGAPASHQKITYYTSTNNYKENIETNFFGWFQCVLELNKWYTIYLKDCFDVKILTPEHSGLAVLDPETMNVRQIYNWIYDSTSAKGIMS